MEYFHSVYCTQLFRIKLTAFKFFIIWFDKLPVPGTLHKPLDFQGVYFFIPTGRSNLYTNASFMSCFMVHESAVVNNRSISRLINKQHAMGRACLYRIKKCRSFERHFFNKKEMIIVSSLSYSPFHLVSQSEAYKCRWQDPNDWHQMRQLPDLPARFAFAG